MTHGGLHGNVEVQVVLRSSVPWYIAIEFVALAGFIGLAPSTRRSNRLVRSFLWIHPSNVIRPFLGLIESLPSPTELIHTFAE